MKLFLVLLFCDIIPVLRAQGERAQDGALTNNICDGSSDNCDHGTCTEQASDFDMPYKCVCNPGYWYNKESRNCELQAHFCDQSSTEGQSINITFSGARYQDLTSIHTIAQRNITECVCNIISLSTVKIIIQDLHVTGDPGQCIMSSGIPSNLSLTGTRFCLFRDNLQAEPKHVALKFHIVPEFVRINLRAVSDAEGSYQPMSVECQKAVEQPTTHFCGGTSANGKSIHIIFSGTISNTAHSVRTECVCKIETQSSPGVNFPFLRLTGGQCIRATGILSRATQEPCPYGSPQMQQISTEKTITLSYDVAPRFVWIILQAGLDTEGRYQPMSVKCQGPVEVSFPTKTTSKTTMTTTITTITEASTPPPSPTTATATTTETPPPSTTTSSSINEYSHQGPQDATVPLVAIVIPIAASLVGAVILGIFILRRRNHKPDIEDKRHENIKDADQNQSEIVQIGHYESIKPRRNDDNYIELEQEHVYNKLGNDTKDIPIEDKVNSAKLTKDKSQHGAEMKHGEYSTLSHRTQSDEHEEYTLLEPDNIEENKKLQNKPESSQCLRKTLEQQDAATSGKHLAAKHENDNLFNASPFKASANDGRHDYFILDSQPTTLSPIQP